MFTPKYIEEGRALAKAARKVINYRKDVARPEDLERVRQHLAALQEALKKRSSEGVQLAEKELLPSLGKLQPVRELSGVRENVELIIVAIVLALGIRAYYLQPFKIPTGSMQPTLNGVIGHRTEAPPPNILVRAFQFVTLGRTYEDVVSEEDKDSIDSISPAKVNPFWGWLGHSNVLRKNLPSWNRSDNPGTPDARWSRQQFQKGRTDCAWLRRSR